MKRPSPSGYLLVAISAAGFSFKPILAKLAYGYGIDAMTLMLMRMFISLPFYLVSLCLIEKGDCLKIERNSALAFPLAGVLGVGCAMFFSLSSLQFISASVSQLVVFMYPTFTALLLFLVYGEKITGIRLASIIVTFLGLCLIARVDHAALFAANFKGVALALASAAAFAAYNVFSQNALKSTSPLKFTTYCMVGLVAFYGGVFGRRQYPTDPTVWGIAALLGIFAGFVAFISYIYGLKKIGAGKAVIVSSLGPVLTTVWAAIFLGENLDAVQLTGMALIIAGVMLLKLRAGAQASVQPSAQNEKA